jgi:hypothetical protein
MKKMDYDTMMGILEKYGYCLDTRETIVFSNFVTGHRTDFELSTFLNLPVFLVKTTAKRAQEKIRAECMKDIKKAGASEELVAEIESHLN